MAFQLTITVDSPEELYGLAAVLTGRARFDREVREVPQAEAAPASAPEVETPKKKRGRSADAVTEAPVPGDILSPADLRKAITAGVKSLAQRDGLQTARELLSRFKVGRVADLSDDQLAEASAAVRAAVQGIEPGVE